MRFAFFLGYYPASIGNSLPKFWDKLSVTSARIQKEKSWRWYRYVVPKRR